MADPKYIQVVIVVDPDTKNEIEVEIWKHENGGMFGIDHSYVEHNMGSCFDPFNGDKLELPELPD